NTSAREGAAAKSGSSRGRRDLLYPKFLEPAEERAPRDSQDPRGFGLVSVGPRQGLDQRLPLARYFRGIFLDCTGCSRSPSPGIGRRLDRRRLIPEHLTRLIGRVADDPWQIVKSNRRSFRHYHRPLDGVLELADVPRPGIPPQRSDD